MCAPGSRKDDLVGDLDEVHARRLASHGALRAWFATSSEALLIAAAFLALRVRGSTVGSGWITWSEVRLAARLARKQPILNATVVLALGTGICLAGSAHTLASAFLFGDVPLPAGARFVRVRAVAEQEGRPRVVGLQRFEALRSGSSAFEYFGALADGSMNITQEQGGVEVLRGVSILPDAFRLLPYRPLAGRTLAPEDGLAGALPVVLLGEAVWTRRFGRDPAVVGRAVSLGGIERVVVGVLPEAAAFPNRPDVWLPLGADAFPADEADGGPEIILFGVLREGVSREAAAGQLEALSSGYERDTPGAPALRMSVNRFTEVPQSFLMYMLMGGMLTVVVLVLMVNAANVGNLVGARTSGRVGELAVRTALGASRRRLVGQLTGEVVLLGAVSAVLGFAGMQALMSWVEGVADDLPFWVDFTPGISTAVFVVAVTLLACAVAGMVPALRSTRRDPGLLLRAGHRGVLGGTMGRAGAAMTVVQVAASVGLMGAAAVVAKGFAGYARTVVDVPSSEILTVGFTPPESAGPDSLGVLFGALETAIGAVPGVEHVGIASAIPRIDARAVQTQVEPVAGDGPREIRPAPEVEARPGFLEALGAAPIAGRLLRREDFLSGSPPVAVVNESFVRDFLGGRNAVGRRLGSPPVVAEGAAAPRWREIVGVVPDLGLSVGDPSLAAGYYVPLEGPSWVYVVVRVAGDPLAYAGAVRRAVFQVEPSLLLSEMETLDAAGSDNITALGTIGAALGALGMMALILSLVSTYAQVSYTVSRRFREIGVRVALGASRASILRSVVGQAALHTSLGSVLGVGIGVVLLQVRGIFVFRIPAGEPWVLPAVALLMTGAAALASWVPAMRALRIRPADALRAD